MPTADSILTLNAGDVTVTIHPDAGCRIGQITIGDQGLLVDVADSPHSMAWGSFPMAPWAGRIRNGRFRFADADRELAINHHDGDGDERAHAIHGLVFDRSWPEVHELSDTSCTASRGLDWEFGGSVTQTIELSAKRVVVTLSIESTDQLFPAELGWHPWFRKPDRLDFSPTAMYERDEFGIPTGAIAEPAEGPWDDCFVNTEPVILQYDRALAPSIRLESDCDHWVVFDIPTGSTCVEPQSGPPDAFNLDPHVVGPDTPLRRTMAVAW